MPEKEVARCGLGSGLDSRSHLMESGIKRMVFQQMPYSLLWVVFNDGSLAGLTFNDEQGIMAWHRHILGGTNVKVRDLASMPSKKSDYDEFFLLSRRDRADHPNAIEVLDR